MIGTAIDSAKAVAKLAHDYGKMDLYQQAVELMAKVTEQQQQIMELSQELFELKKQLADVAADNKLRSELVIKDHAYYRPLDGGKLDGPFCCRCFDADQKLIRIQPGNAGWYCEQCWMLRIRRTP